MKTVCSLVWMSACWGAVLLAGCAGPQSITGASGNPSDLITDSDETDQRRRARLRVELATDPGFVDAYNLRGLVYMRLNDIPLAEDSFRRALAINSRDASVAHNYGWLLCQQSRYDESFKLFAQAVANPTYTGKAKTLMALGVCQVNAGQTIEAEQSLMRSYELDAGNPVTGYNLSKLLYASGDLTRAQFYIRRLNNSELANAQTLWLGIKTERKLNDHEAVAQLAGQLKKRFAQSAEAAAYEKGLFNE
jgi:type IV pilus assembly protein PilF